MICKGGFLNNDCDESHNKYLCYGSTVGTCKPTHKVLNNGREHVHHVVWDEEDFM